MQHRFLFMLAGLVAGSFLLSSPSLQSQTSISGYIQAEWLHFDQSTNPNGRAFYSDGEKNLFQIRRGRVKFTHQEGRFTGVIQPDFTERGVSIKDAYFTVGILDKDLLDVTLGIFARPNYEVELSSSKRESPERSQVIRAFYPGERDLGFMFTSSPALTDNFKPQLQVGLFNGNQRETDPLKDLATRLVLPLPLGPDSKVSANVGGSFYYGGIPQPEDSVIKFEDGMQVVAFGNGEGSAQGWGNRRHVGVETQIAADILPIGKTELRGEFLTGVRPTPGTRTVLTDISSDSIIIEPVETPTLILRNQAGYYVQLSQELSEKFMVAAKYDVFDRNTDLSGDQVLSADDRKSTVIGFGAIGTFGPVRITAWYEIPSFAADEARYINSAGETSSDDLKDNKTTLRFQYKFK